ncbi:hypothetical protein [Blastopirellula marina]|uniref:Carboxypeptidase regulatory-like domain-containing protein n=1 Tax=Blastopirellula marina TaxID=124 RepID=A0A2S8GJW9_9BACT|nr:hypothetical protein [Blastopirellula marina]PQO44611.1 hypothetical protein C5Y93_17730 [Blastopirellula marina]
MTRNPFLSLAAAAFCLTAFLSSGCGGTSTQMDVAPTSGRVEFQGKPVADVYVQLMPTETSGTSDKPGKAAGGATDSDGKFVLSTYESGDGAIPGKHRVTISVQNPGAKLPGKLPADYTVEIKPEPNDLVLKLDK